MEATEKKIALLHWLTGLDDEGVIDKIDLVRRDYMDMLYRQNTPHNANDVEAKIKKAESDILSGKSFAHHDVVQMMVDKFGD